MFLPDAVRPGNTWVSEVKRLRGKKQPLTAAPSALGFRISAFPISTFQHARPRPRRRNPDPGAHPQRPRQAGLRPDPGGARPNMASHAALHLHPVARLPQARLAVALMLLTLVRTLLESPT